jgi:hypothetical protein
MKLFLGSLLLTALGIAGAAALTVSQTFSGITAANIGVAGAAATEFPVGTKWSLQVEWDDSAAPLSVEAMQSQYRLTKLTLTLQGASGPWTTSSLPNEASFTLNKMPGTGDQIQFTSGWGAADHSNQTLENLSPQSINLTLADPSGNAIPALTPAPSGINLSAWTLPLPKSYLKFYVSETGTAYISGEIQSQPEIAVTQSGKTLADGKGAVGFGKVAVGKTATKTFVIRNTGSGPLTGLRLVKAGKHRTDLSVGTLAKTSLAPGNSLRFKLSFRPKATGPRSALLKVLSNDADEGSFEVRLTGTGN